MGRQIAEHVHQARFDLMALALPRDPVEIGLNPPFADLESRSEGWISLRIDFGQVASLHNLGSSAAIWMMPEVSLLAGFIVRLERP
jgi:hypothetical protein